MNNYDFQGYTYQDMMPVNNITLPNTFQNVAGANQNQTLANPNTTSTNNQNAMLYPPQEGFIRGNLFKNLYDPYKNMRPANLVARNEQEQMYLNLSALSFAAHELNLYLDNYPNDVTMIRLFNDYRKMATQAMNDYEKKYGPLTMKSDQLTATPWAWETTGFPWNEGGM